MTTELRVEAGGERLDVFVTRMLPALTRSRVQRLIEQQHVTVDGAAARPALKLVAGQRVVVDEPAAIPDHAMPEHIPLDVLYEDADLIAVNKPAGMTVHPSPGHASATLVNAILAHCADLSGIGGVLRPGIVHRLDRDTSGVILIAKNDGAHQQLARQLRERTVAKTYIAVVEGTPSPPEGVIEAPLARDPRNRQRMAVVEGGREASTRYRLLERFHGASLVEAHPATGRTHQIRVHLAAIGHAVAGDRTYGRAQKMAPRQMLHALRIAFAHPRTGNPLTIEAPPPDDFERLLERLRSGAALA